MKNILLTICMSVMLTTIPIFNVPDDYMPEVYRVSDEILNDFLSDQEETEEEIENEIDTENVEEDSEDYSLMALEASETVDLDPVIERLDKIIKYSNYEEFENPEAFQNSNPYVSRYEYEMYNLLKYMVVLSACQVGGILLLIFAWRSRNGNS